MALQRARKALECCQALLRSSAPHPGWGRRVRRSQVKKRGGGSGGGCDGGGCQTWRGAGRSGNGGSALAPAGGQSRGEGASDLGLRPRAGVEGSGLPRLVQSVCFYKLCCVSFSGHQPGE